ncbi:integral membrane protein [Grosmannia clavigera kw1407]|uniref:Integral membrane protein n=1 Tax=Grosmannia clavigera (strain kw1407 / UAMH 11150) TaxID=655863 RepID=F0X7Z3_GROCL|nr:uncharacterized protein CMQ_6881 [Grosmannia clavigera kw1407]EFX06560.1 integral membrane protein [Grosmannia clavigera kw1407]
MIAAAKWCVAPDKLAVWTQRVGSTARVQHRLCAKTARTERDTLCTQIPLVHRRKRSRACPHSLGAQPLWQQPANNRRQAMKAVLPRPRGRWDQAVPPALRPLVRAYLLGYASTVAPQLLAVLLAAYAALRRRRRAAAEGLPPEAEKTASLAAVAASVRRIFGDGLAWHGFPTFCAALVGGGTLLEVPFDKLLSRWPTGLSRLARARLARCLASFVSGYCSIQLLQGRETTDERERKTSDDGSKAREPATEPTKTAGRTLDLTLFAATGAADVLVGSLWARWRGRRSASQSRRRWTRTEALVGAAIDPALFALSSALVMWTWIYEPWRLPRSYDRWITAAAAVDGRLIEALRRCRRGSLRYGEQADRPDNDQSCLLQEMCRDYGWPPVWGDPAFTMPFPCDMVHMGCGPSCERHAVVRLWRSWRWALATYLPLSLTLLLRPVRGAGGAAARPRALLRRLVRALLAAARSSAFLAAFVSLFFYGVCLARVRIGPRLLGRSAAACQAIDGGLCTAAGCALCGWSILLERPGRRRDIALFVAPRALATLLPRRYHHRYLWRESLLFAASSAVVLTTVREHPRRVRGLLGSVLKTVVAP